MATKRKSKGKGPKPAQKLALEIANRKKEPAPDIIPAAEEFAGSPAEVTAPAEPPTAEQSEASTPRAAKPRGSKKPATTAPTKMSALDAAAKVLEETGEPMTTGAMIEAMSVKKYWSSPNGATPAATLYSAILREINTKGKDSRFKKTERGKFARKA